MDGSELCNTTDSESYEPTLRGMNVKDDGRQTAEGLSTRGPSSCWRRSAALTDLESHSPYFSMRR